MIFKIFSVFIIIIILYADLKSAGLENQGEEKWQYKSQEAIFNEETHEVLSYQPTVYDEPIDLSVVKTMRLFSFPTSSFMTNEGNSVSFNFTMVGDGFLFLSRKGGIPLFGNHTLLGSVELNLENGSSFQIPIEEPIFWIVGSPETVITSSLNVSYYRYTSLLREIYEPANDLIVDDIGIVQDYIISTDQDLNDPIRNYTVTETRREIFIGINGLDLRFQEIVNEITMMFTLESSEPIPTYIKQSEPADTTEFPNLNQGSRFIEYVLIRANSNSSSDHANSSALFISMIGILILQKIRKPVGP